MTTFPAIRIEGGLFGPDFLATVAAADAPDRRSDDDIAVLFTEACALWHIFQRRLDRLPLHDRATTLTRDVWLIPFLRLLEYAPVPNPAPVVRHGVSFSISHRAGPPDDAPPLHLVGARQSLDRIDRTAQPRYSPHTLLQEVLNRSDQIWGIVSNGLTIRLLRASVAIRRQAYLEFDLQRIVSEQRFHEFAILVRLLHRSSLPSTAADARTCAIEDMYQRALNLGDRVRDRLRTGVTNAIQCLANGFLAHRANRDLRDLVTRDRVTGAQTLYHALLHVVYRILFLLVAESRGAIGTSPLYRDHYSVSRLYRMLHRHTVDPDHDDLWCGFRVLWHTLATEEYAAWLGVPPLNGNLFTAHNLLDTFTIANHDLLTAFWHLAFFRDTPTAPPRRVNYAALDVEELGSVYESLLDDHPQIVVADGYPPRLVLVAGSERKTTGSYYTPPSLVGALIRTTLDPLLADRLAAAPTVHAKEQAILGLRVLDPACGSGHFLLAAARRLGTELARVRAEGGEPDPHQRQIAMREVIAQCIYGVDKNPLAVELARVALWIESHVADKPLTFLDHHIQCGDALVGLPDLALLDRAIPDEAFDPITTDDRRIAYGVQRRNRIEAGGQTTLDAAFDTVGVGTEFGTAAAEITRIRDDTVAAVRAKKERYRHLCSATERLRTAGHLWTAAFFQARRADGPSDRFITTDTVRRWLARQSVAAAAVDEATALATQHGFFHWPLAFPDVFAQGGFDVVLGNPPWEQIQLAEQEFFAARDPEIARAATAAGRKRRIAELPTTNPGLWEAYRQALHVTGSVSRFLRGSGCYPLTGRGRLNTYSVFTERMRALVRPGGRMGVIVPTGIATDETNKHFFADIVARGEVVSLFGMTNRKHLFREVGTMVTFVLLTLRREDGRSSTEPAEFAFFLHDPADVTDAERRFTMTPDDLRLLNPNTRTAPVFRSRRDAELTKYLYRRIPVLIDEGKGAAGNPWGVEFAIMEFAIMFDMAADSGLFRTAPTGTPPLVPLYEGKLVHQFDHRFATYRQGDTEEIADAAKADPAVRSTPRYWVPADAVDARLRAKGWERGWLLGWRGICRSTDERTVIAAVIPRVGVGDTFLLMFPNVPDHAPLLLGILNSLCVDYAARQKLGGVSLKCFTMKQLPVLPPSIFAQPLPFPWRDAPSAATIADFVRPRVLELTYTAWDLAPFARDLGYDGPPFRWDAERRFWLRAELDALCFHLYLGSAEEWEREAGADLKALFPTPRDAAVYILDQFPIVKRRDEARFGEYRTARAILSIYDAMAEAQRSGQGGQSSGGASSVVEAWRKEAREWQ